MNSLSGNVISEGSSIFDGSLFSLQEILFFYLIKKINKKKGTTCRRKEKEQRQIDTDKEDVNRRHVGRRGRGDRGRLDM